MAFPHDWHRSLHEDFLNALEEKREPRISGREALRVHRLIDALIAAGTNGKTIWLSAAEAEGRRQRLEPLLAGHNVGDG